MTRLLAAATLAFVLGGADQAGARPDLRRPLAAGPLTLFPDEERLGVYYYPPGELSIAAAKDGRPEMSFLHLRYSGSVVTADRGRHLYRSLLTIRVVLERPAQADMAAARAVVGARAELRPMPIRRLDTVLVYTPVDETTSDTGDARVLPDGHAEPADGRATPAGHYWAERIYTVLLGPNDAQILLDAFDAGRVAMSLGYAFYADGIAPAAPLDDLRGPAEMVEALRGRRPAPGRTDDADSAGHLVRAGVVKVTLQPGEWPGLVRKVDTDASAPPGYAVLDVRCYDFAHALREDLFEKQVEIEAEGASGRTARLSAIFERDSPDVYVRTLRFPVAVRLDRPYRYRLVEIALDGRVREGVWRTRESWVQELDVTGAAVTGGGDK